MVCIPISSEITNLVRKLRANFSTYPSGHHNKYFTSVLIIVKCFGHGELIPALVFIQLFS